MAQVDFPYGKKRNWELDTADVDIGLKSVSDRYRIMFRDFSTPIAHCNSVLCLHTHCANVDRVSLRCIS